MLFGLFYLRPPRLGPGAIAVLTAENRNRVRRNQLVSLEHELGIKAIAGGLIDGLSAEAAIEFVFVIVIAAEIQLLAVRRELFLLIQDDELGRVPRLTRFADVAPKLIDRAFKIAAADKVIAGRLRRDLLGRIDPRLLDPRRLHRPAASQQKEAEENLEGEKKTKGVFAHGTSPFIAENGFVQFLGQGAGQSVD